MTGTGSVHEARLIAVAGGQYPTTASSKSHSQARASSPTRSFVDEEGQSTSPTREGSHENVVHGLQSSTMGLPVRSVAVSTRSW